MAISKSSIESKPYNVYIGKNSLDLNRIKERKRKTYYFLKRFIDISGSLLGIFFLSPVFFIIALMIKIENPKERVIFRQVRVGKNGKLFRINKFRSMVSDAEQLLDNLLDKNETTGAMFKMKNDPRVTRIGHFIRRTSLDELPQFINVLKGDMSLVGPRPPLPREVDKYTEYDKQRLLVKPGCTGLWQVSGRSQVGFDKMVELDLLYISRRNIRLDIKIILKTIIMLFGSQNAF